MEPRTLLDALSVAERLKDTTRHCYTAKGRHENVADEMLDLYEEMAKRETVEAKIFKAIDSLEALVQHNISDLSTWIPKEYELNKTYADDKVVFSEYLQLLREEIRKDTFAKIGE